MRCAGGFWGARGRGTAGIRQHPRWPSAVMVRTKPWPVYSMEQVAEHNHKDDCWVGRPCLIVALKTCPRPPEIPPHLLACKSAASADPEPAARCPPLQIVVDDKVYDMSPHVKNHEGWIGSGKISTLLAILSCMGTDCTDDFNATHDSRGFRELHSFQVCIRACAPAPPLLHSAHGFRRVPRCNAERPLSCRPAVPLL